MRASEVNQCPLWPCPLADTTTLHSISSAVVKLSKLTKAVPVFRGTTSMKMPEEFLKADDTNIKG